MVLPPAKPTSLLAALLLRPGEVVPVDRLLEAVWGERQPATAKSALQSCVLRLRRLLAKYGIAERMVVAVAGGYRLTADADTLDLLHFRRLTAEASGAGEAELPLLRTALGLWRGPLLANVPSELLHRDEVPRLAEQRLRALERVCELQLAQGRCREVLVDLWEATGAHPHHEGLSAQLMRALYGAGRQNEALAEYRRIRGRLRDELGVDPGPPLRALELAILRGEELRGLPRGEAVSAGLTGPTGSPGPTGPAPAAGASAGAAASAAAAGAARAVVADPVADAAHASGTGVPGIWGGYDASGGYDVSGGYDAFDGSGGVRGGTAVGCGAGGGPSGRGGLGGRGGRGGIISTDGGGAAAFAGHPDGPPDASSQLLGGPSDIPGGPSLHDDRPVGLGDPSFPTEPRSAGHPPSGSDDQAYRSGARPSSPGEQPDRRLVPAGGPAHGTPLAPRLPHVPGFTGRAGETAELVARLNRTERAPDDTAPVLTVISGGPGMGKTALARHTAHLVADRYPGGAVLVSLTTPDGTPRPVEEAAAELRSRLAPSLSRGACLVVLDDVMHPDQVRHLLAGTSAQTARGAVLVTSRRRLAALVATHGPAVLHLGALPRQESLDLLARVLGRPRVAAEPAAARALTDLCGHVPLALRIVLARLLTRPAQRLADCAAWLRRDLPARLALPDDPRMSVPLLLDDALRRLPAPLADAHLRLARLDGKLTPTEAADALAVPETRAEEVLEQLLDRGLLDEEQPGRLRMNTLFRAHALHRATRSGDAAHPLPPVARHALPSGAT
ncbi:BTAD domain-containing putative transcriptional regulator [Streptomyces sp. bgisy022]|uniref:AfsR/SARP family transcriptional regulator n=1 Tax=Streptomyces sp. bgisy022 TaxID=3413769 RepID=UPI003D720685